MLGLISCVAFFYLTHWLISWLAEPFTYTYFTIWIAYYALSEIVEWYGLLHAPSWRRSRFSQYVGRTLYNSKFNEALDQHWRYNEIKPGPIMFILEPHGYASLHMVFGFAAHGGALPQHIADRTFVVAHWTCRLLPIIRNIFSAFGVIYSNRAWVERVLQRGDNLAVCASGITGKFMAMRDFRVGKLETGEYRYVYDTAPYSFRHNGRVIYRSLRFGDGSPMAADYLEQDYSMVVVQRSTKKLGCFKLAADYCSTIYPLYSPNECRTYSGSMYSFTNSLPPLLANCFAMTLMPAFGHWLILQQRTEDYEWFFGDPILIDRTVKKPTAEQLATAYYKELSELGKHLHRPVVYDFDRTLFKTDDKLNE